jgi:hypothetical protein
MRVKPWVTFPISAMAEPPRARKVVVITFSSWLNCHVLETVGFFLKYHFGVEALVWLWLVDEILQFLRESIEIPNRLVTYLA